MRSNKLPRGPQDRTEQSAQSRPKRSLPGFLLLTPNGWRIMGGGALAVAGLMAWYGSSAMLNPKEASMPLWLYWGVFLALLLVALVTVLLDIRYVRMRFLLEERAMYEKIVRKKTGDAVAGNDAESEKRVPER